MMSSESSTEISSLPFQITKSGSYRVTSSLDGIGPEDFLHVLAPDVTIDLQGHQLHTRSAAAVLIGAPKLTLHSGMIKSSSIGLASEPHVKADDCHFNHLDVKGGIFLGGARLQVSHCKIEGGTYGIKAGLSAQIQHCQVTGALVLGIEVDAGSEISFCTVSHCQEGVYAYGSREHPCHLEQVIAYECEGLGLRMDGPGTLLRCEAHHNGQSDPEGGILAGPASVVRQCVAYHNQGGDISIVEPCELADNQTSTPS